MQTKKQQISLVFMEEAYYIKRVSPALNFGLEASIELQLLNDRTHLIRLFTNISFHRHFNFL